MDNNTKHDDWLEEPTQLDNLSLQIPPPTTKQDLWERKLLDFTLRNALINMRSASVLSFVSFDLDKLEDKLHQNVDIHIDCFPASPFSTTEKSGFFHSIDFAEQLQEIVQSGVRSGCLYAYRREKELKDQLKKLYRNSRVAMEENGANTLFLNFGVVRWFETATSDVPRYAPLVLIPMDILRKGGDIGYVLRIRDEEPIFNITLVEYLKQVFHIDISALLPMPEDEFGLDIRRIFNFVREKISCQPRWELREEMNLGLFSFNKFVMWNDIHNHRNIIEKNSIIRSLIDGKMLIEDIPSRPATTFDATINPSDIAMPVDVDSSQMKAIVDSGNGRSFILYGPPGTGKSQTITNMIANALYQKKRVLFVAEKRAALEVVQSRLAKVGLAPFCLELHSNKVSKQYVLQQLQDAIKVRHITHNDKYDSTSIEIKQQREKLTSYIHALHKKGDKGVSLYDCMTRYLSIEGDVLHDFPTNLTASEIDNLAEQVRELDTVFRITGHPAKSPLASLFPKDTELETIEKIQSLLETLDSSSKDLLKIEPFLNEHFHLVSFVELKTLDKFLETVEELTNTPNCPSANLLAIIDDANACNELNKIIESGKEWAELNNSLTTTCKQELFLVDALALLNEYQTIMSKNFLSRFFALRSFLRKLQLFTSTITKEKIETFVFSFYKWSQVKHNIEQEASRLYGMFGRCDLSNSSSWNKMTDILQQAIALCNIVRELSPASYLQNKQALMSNSESWSEAHTKHAKQLNSYIASGHKFLNALTEFDTLTDSSGWHNGTLSSTCDTISVWNEHSQEIHSWCQYTSRKKQLCESGLEPVINYILENEVSASSAAAAFQKGIYKYYAKRLIATNKYLCMFNGLLFEQQVQKYRSLVSEFKMLTMKELYHRLASTIPSLTMEASNSSEVGILLRNISNGCRGNSIRNLIDQIPTLLPRLCPCMLMSPLSVAQYLDIEKQQFDLIVFDEASQMPTSEAVGAIARGRALVVVGDPRQMPPTNFFQTQQVDDEEADIDDLESILDDCISISMPEHYLSWHYRSRHESLISFSNQQYYDGKLMTFPSVDNRESKVRYVHIQGTYDMGKTRCNRAEAEAIVKEVLRRLKQKDNESLSIGIVAFSKVQQDLIEDLLTDALDKSPELKEAAYEVPEPIFIKNLENVQGDERDVILFSVGYGPDANGNVSMNFGPLNKRGGERRLNVAVSRARYEMILFSTLAPEQIDPERTTARGVLGLRQFLEFARDGQLHADDVQYASHQEKGVIAAIANTIRMWGYQVDTMVGMSRFRVDIAVINPAKPSEYLLGILCDGENFFATPTNRDRNVVQPNVLSGLGWNILRIWSVDWYINQHQTCQYLKAALKDSVAGTFVSNYVLPKSSSPFSVEDEPEEEIATHTFNKKDIEQFVPGEIQEAIKITLKEQISLPEDELLNQTRKRLGFARLGNNVEKVIRYNLKTLTLIGDIVYKPNGNITLNEEKFSIEP